MKTKHCKRCNTIKAMDAFGRNNLTTDGRSCYCKSCKAYISRMSRARPTVEQTKSKLVDTMYEDSNKFLSLFGAKSITRTFSSYNSRTE